MGSHLINNSAGVPKPHAVGEEKSWSLDWVWKGRLENHSFIQKMFNSCLWGLSSRWPLGQDSGRKDEKRKVLAAWDLQLSVRSQSRQWGPADTR